MWITEVLRLAQITKKRYMAPQHGGVLSVVLGPLTLTVLVLASDLRWRWFWVRWKEEMLSFHQDPTKLKTFDLCWRKPILKFGSRIFSVENSEKSKNRKNKDFNWKFSKFLKNRDFKKIGFFRISKIFNWNPCFSIFTFLEIWLFFRPIFSRAKFQNQFSPT